MKYFSDTQSGGAFNQANDEDIKVLVVYENFSAAQRAISLFQRVAHQLGKPSPLNVVLWKYDHLAVPALLEMAAEDAANADLIVVAGQEAPELPSVVQTWITLWLLRKKGDPRALVALVEDGPEQRALRPGVRSYLRKVARAGRMDFLDEAGVDGKPSSRDVIEPFSMPDTAARGDHSEAWFDQQARSEWN